MKRRTQGLQPTGCVIDIDPEEAVHRLLTAPPEKKGRSASAKSANEEDPTKD